LNCRMVTALAFVPINDLHEAFDAIHDHLSEEYKPVLDWFGDNYVGKFFDCI
jgi:hypothetical protein